MSDLGLALISSGTTIFLAMISDSDLQRIWDKPWENQREQNQWENMWGNSNLTMVSMVIFHGDISMVISMGEDMGKSTNNIGVSQG